MRPGPGMSNLNLILQENPAWVRCHYASGYN